MTDIRTESIVSEVIEINSNTPDAVKVQVLAPNVMESMEVPGFSRLTP